MAHDITLTQKGRFMGVEGQPFITSVTAHGYINIDTSSPHYQAGPEAFKATLTAQLNVAGIKTVDADSTRIQLKSIRKLSAALKEFGFSDTDAKSVVDYTREQRSLHSGYRRR